MSPATHIPRSTARVVCPLAMALCVAGLPTCLYFASQSDTVGPHLGLVFTALILLSIFCYALRVLLAPLDQQGTTGGPRRRPVLDAALPPSPHDAKSADRGAHEKSTEADGPVAVPALPARTGVSSSPRSAAAVPQGDAHIQGEIGRW